MAIAESPFDDVAACGARSSCAAHHLVVLRNVAELLRERQQGEPDPAPRVRPPASAPVSAFESKKARDARAIIATKEAAPASFAVGGNLRPAIAAAFGRFERAEMSQPNAD